MLSGTSEKEQCVCVGAGAAVVQWSQVSVPCTRHYTTYNSVTVSQLTHETRHM